jgi:hypothetical protein
MTAERAGWMMLSIAITGAVISFIVPSVLLGIASGYLAGLMVCGIVGARVSE